MIAMMKAACFLLLLLLSAVIAFKIDDKIWDTIATHIEDKYPDLTGKGLVKKILKSAGNDDIEPLIQMCEMMKYDNRDGCEKFSKEFKKMMNFKLAFNGGRMMDKTKFHDFLRVTSDILDVMKDIANFL